MGEERYLIDPYRDWLAKEGLPVSGGFGVDLLDVAVAPWPRHEAKGAMVLLDGRGDFVDLAVLEIAPGLSTAPQRHLYEEVVFVLAGSGSTTVELPNGQKRSFEWGQNSLFALPLNARYRHHNASGRVPARLALVSDLPIMLNVFRNEAFIWENDAVFPERFGQEKDFAGDGTFIPQKPGRHMWETNFVPDLASFKLQEWKQRGAAGSNIMFSLADGTMHSHISEMPVGTYKKGHRHGADFHVFAVSGRGYSIYWYEGDKDFERFDWKHGGVFAPADRQLHQHFNTSPEPARYLAIAFGSLRYPTIADKKATWLGMDVNVKAGGRQVEYEDEDPRIIRMYEEELRKNGVASRMREFVPA